MFTLVERNQTRKKVSEHQLSKARCFIDTVMFDYQNVFIKIDTPDIANLDHCQREFLYFYVQFHILNKDSNIVLIITLVEYTRIEPQSLNHRLP